MRERITLGSLGGFLQRSWKQPIWQNLAPKVAQLQAGDSAIDGMEDFSGKDHGKTLVWFIHVYPMVIKLGKELGN